MNKYIIAAAACAALASSAAMAQDFKAGDLLVRARAVRLSSDNGGSLGQGTATDLSINDKTIPEVDFTYFFDKNLAAELILTVPQRQDVSSGATKLGTLKHLPPTLTAQYHFDPVSGFKPYVGAGVNFTNFSSVEITHPTAGPLDVKRQSYGLALQVGVDYELAKNLYLNLDVKKVQIKTDVSVQSSGATLGSFKVDPLLVGVGLGWRF